MWQKLLKPLSRQQSNHPVTLRVRGERLDAGDAKRSRFGWAMVA